MQAPRPSFPARLSVFAFAVLSLAGGWLIVYGGGFAHQPSRYSPAYVVITGLPAIVMALVQYVASALAFTWLLGQRMSRLLAATLAFSLVFAPALLFVAFGSR